MFHRFGDIGNIEALHGSRSAIRHRPGMQVGIAFPYVFLWLSRVLPLGYRDSLDYAIAFSPPVFVVS
jgi:hypothetical protein